MESSSSTTTISTFCGTLAAFLTHLQTSSQALSHSLQRRPIPLDSAASSFVQCLDRRVSSAGGDLDLLESMAFGTVSFEELLGHCGEVYKRNQAYISLLEDRLRSFGYVPFEIEIDVDDEDGDIDVNSTFLSPENISEPVSFGWGSVSAAGSIRRKLEEDPLFDDSMSLQNLGLSDACLATLASSEAKDDLASPRVSSDSYYNGETYDPKMTSFPSVEVFDSKGILEDGIILDKCASRTRIEISKGDYDKLPSYMKSLASWEDLQEAVVKMNSELCKQDGSARNNSFNQDDLETLGLGRKGRSYLLLLVRMNRFVVETVDGSIVYRAVVDKPAHLTTSMH